MLAVRNLSVTLGGRAVLRDISFDLFENDLLMVVGPNGSGKTTMVRSIMGALPHRGEALLRGDSIGKMPPAQRARGIAVLTQQNPAPFAYTAYEVVSMGRYAHRSGLLEGLTRQDEAAVREAMEKTRTLELAGRKITTLSGGELQRVYLARALAQEPDVLLLDEPVNHLDPEHQLLLLDTVAAWAKEPGHAALAILHDLNLARAYGTRAMLLDQGRRVAYGTPEEVFEDENLQKVYHVDLGEWMRESLGRW